MDQEALKAKFVDTGSESAVVACVFKDLAYYHQVETKLTEKDFLSPTYRAIWTIIKSLMRENLPALSAADILDRAKALQMEKQVGGYDLISALFDKRVEPDNLDFYISRVSDASVKFKARCTAQEISELIEENKDLTGTTLDATSLVDLAQQKFLQIRIETQRAVDATDLAEGLPELLEETTQPTSGRGLLTGFPLLDEAINGLEPGSLTVLGARPKVGKSATLLGWAKNIAYYQGIPVLYIDTEMSKREQQFRLLSMLSQVPEREIKRGEYLQDPVKRNNVEQASQLINSGLILHKYYPDFTAEGVASLIRKERFQNKIGCVVFDYIKLPDADLQKINNVKEHQALGYLCVALKNVAGQEQLPIVTAAQIGRQGAGEGKVSSADFADSDRILRYANTLLGLTRKTRKEIEDLEKVHLKDEVIKMGSHRLQILDTRAGGTDYDGIDICFRPNVLTMWEGLQRKDLMPMSPKEEESD